MWMSNDSTQFHLPKPVRLKALSQGESGLRWLAGLEQTVADLAQQWQIRIGELMNGGSEGLVLSAVQVDGTPVVLKIGIPGVSYMANEAHVLRLAAGRGYPRLLSHSKRHNAILMERLGTQLAASGKSTRDQIALICQTLSTAWIPLDTAHGLTTGAEKAQGLADLITTLWQELGQPCLPLTYNLALAFAKERHAAHDPGNAVLVHGDAHASNTLKTLCGGDDTSYKFVDPDGLFAEPAYDLAIPMREWSEELLAGDAVQLGAERCELLSALTGVAKRPIYQWGFIERVSTGLYLLQLGLTDLGRQSLTVADRWAKSQMSWK